MNVIKSGGIFQIYGDALTVYEKIPVGTYDVCYDKLRGMFFQPHCELVVNEEKVYGHTHAKVEKVLRSFSSVNRNFGIILSGRKGAGKSLFARILAIRAQEQGIPVLIVSSYIPGLANFLSSIDQEVIVLFDEFEKTYYNSDTRDEPQEELLPLLDGTDSGKKLYVITCNDVKRLNECLLNRPGRFHYHFVMDSPSVEEIREYMTDKLSVQYQGEIERIIQLSMTTEFTYDVLRAIAFELNNGYSLKETIEDLNISKERDPKYSVHVEFTDGAVFETYGCSVDMNTDIGTSVWVQSKTETGGRNGFYIEFDPKNFVYDYENLQLIMPVETVARSVDSDDFDLSNEKEKERRDYLMNQPISSVTFKRVMNSSVRKFIV